MRAGYSVHRISASLPSAWMCVDRITCSVVGRAPDDDRAGAVAEQHRHVAPGGRDVEAGRVHLGADQQDVLEHAGADVRVGDRQAVDEARALLADVEARESRLRPSRRCTNTPVPGKM